MNYEKIIAVEEFLRTRNQKFKVTVYVNQHGYIPIISGFTISEDIARSDYIFDSENEILRPYIGGFLQKGVNFLENVRFDGIRLCFSVENIDIMLE